MNDKVMSDTPEQEEFRAHCREWLSSNLPKPFTGQVRTTDHPRISTPEYFRWMQDWQMSAFEGGLVGCDYPKEYGCGGRTDCQRIAKQAFLDAELSESHRLTSANSINVGRLLPQAPSLLPTRACGPRWRHLRPGPAGPWSLGQAPVGPRCWPPMHI